MLAQPVRDPPPAELLRCPVPPAGFPRAEAVLPPDVRAAMIRLATSHAALARQLARLIAWTDPKACP